MNEILFLINFLVVTFCISVFIDNITFLFSYVTLLFKASTVLLHIRTEDLSHYNIPSLFEQNCLCNTLKITFIMMKVLFSKKFLHKNAMIVYIPYIFYAIICHIIYNVLIYIILQGEHRHPSH